MSKSKETESRLLVGGSGGRKAFLRRLLKMFWSYIVVTISQCCKYAKNHGIVYSKRVDLKICELSPFFFFFFSFFQWPYLWHMEVLRPGVESEIF